MIVMEGSLMGAYDWSRQYKVGQKWRLRDGIETITVIRVHDNGSMTAEWDYKYDGFGNHLKDTWDSQGWFQDYWSPSANDLSNEVK